MSKTLEIVNGISQVLSNTYDGALDENGEPIKIGLNREEGHVINDSRVMDGFSVKFHGNAMSVHYHADVKLKEVHENGFESEVESKIASIAGFLKKEYKKLTGNSLDLVKEGEVDVMVQSTSRVRSFVQASCMYRMSGTDAEAISEESTDNLDDNIKKFLSMGAEEKSPENVTRDDEKFEHFKAWSIKSGQRN